MEKGPIKTRTIASKFINQKKGESVFALPFKLDKLSLNGKID